MDNRDWLVEAQRQLGRTSSGMLPAQRGAFTLRSPDVHVLFGNGGDDEVLLLRCLLREIGATILAYDETPERPCWAMIVRSRLKAPLLSEIVVTAAQAMRAAVRPQLRFRTGSRRRRTMLRASLN